MIRSYRDPRAQAILRGEVPRGLSKELCRAAIRRLIALDSAEALAELRLPPSNRLEALRGDRAGQHSIRINRQWRLCFRWTEQGPEDVEIVDYH
ncbi:MAG: type II toxin-antitoxin system RelE/ParE family toxin [Pseudomonadota bacterium]